jgi:hypothetical protein
MNSTVNRNGVTQHTLMSTHNGNPINTVLNYSACTQVFTVWLVICNEWCHYVIWILLLLRGSLIT